MLNHLLTDKELEFVVELLEAESRRLMLEARRTDASAMRKELRGRLRVADRLIERFHEIKAGNLKS